MFKSQGYVAVEGGRCPATGVGQRHVQCAPVAGYGRSVGQAAPLDPVHKTGQRGLLDAKAVCQLSHPPRAVGQNA